ncbi:MAG: hypothetical protein IPF87_03915 [Gemmatimonadetes bacterium]|nr:hypothetical protein [Gemmatimonadota bacterium]MBK6455219.1 hypothetical protein [Gemmatimonadota bacterium]MBK6841403.1 hypothetical protein [Gemmatimonadota bacterium]MBK7835092.1 hypothetical protein [Gemmatimonadota bacterium]MBK8645146.1 hypothetical protein [Gemmatimonadota bacterium]
MTDAGDEHVQAPGEDEREPESVASISALYLGNILYALEACALGMDQQGQGDHAAFYRGIARKLAEARGREKA